MLEIVVEDMKGKKIFHSEDEVCLSFYWDRYVWNRETDEYIEGKYSKLFPKNGECFIYVRDNIDFREYGIQDCKWFDDYKGLVTEDGFLRFDTRLHSFWFMRFGVTLIRSVSEGWVITSGYIKDINKAILMNEVVECVDMSTIKKNYVASMRDWNSHSQFRCIEAWNLPVGKLEGMMDELMELSKGFSPMVSPDENEQGFKYPGQMEICNSGRYLELFDSSRIFRNIVANSIEELLEILEI